MRKKSESKPNLTSISENGLSTKQSYIRQDITSRRPITEWAVYATILLLAIGFMCGPLMYDAIATDRSGLCLIILVLFTAALAKNFSDIRFVSRELQITNEQIERLVNLNDFREFLKTQRSGVFHTHVRYLYEMGRRDVEIRQDNLIALMQTRLTSRIRTTDIASGLLVTLGLVGTIMGLISAVSGLSEVMNATGGEQSEMMSGLQLTLSGMGTAFYTTLLGALLGAVALRLLGNIVETNVDYLVSHIAELSEVYIVPSLRRFARKKQKREDEEDEFPRDGRYQQ